MSARRERERGKMWVPLRAHERAGRKSASRLPPPPPDSLPLPLPLKNDARRHGDGHHMPGRPLGRDLRGALSLPLRRRIHHHAPVGGHGGRGDPRPASSALAGGGGRRSVATAFAPLPPAPADAHAHQADRPRWACPCGCSRLGRSRRVGRGGPHRAAMGGDGSVSEGGRGRGVERCLRAPGQPTRLSLYLSLSCHSPSHNLPILTPSPATPSMAP
jgi:hypothetical protein